MFLLLVLLVRSADSFSQQESRTLSKAREEYVKARDAFESTRIRLESRIARDVALVQSLVEYFSQRIQIDTTRLLTAAKATENLTLSEIVWLGPSLIPQDEMAKPKLKLPAPPLDVLDDAAYVAAKRTLPAPQRRKILAVDFVDTQVVDEEVVVDPATKAIRAIDSILILAEKFFLFALPKLSNVVNKISKNTLRAFFTPEKTSYLDGLKIAEEETPPEVVVLERQIAQPVAVVEEDSIVEDFIDV